MDESCIFVCDQHLPVHLIRQAYRNASNSHKDGCRLAMYAKVDKTLYWIGVALCCDSSKFEVYSDFGN